MRDSHVIPEIINDSSQSIEWQRKVAYGLMASIGSASAKATSDVDANEGWRRCLTHSDSGIRICISSWIGCHGGPKSGQWLVEAAVEEGVESAQLTMLYGAWNIFSHHANEIYRIKRFYDRLSSLAKTAGDKVSASCVNILFQIDPLRAQKEAPRIGERLEMALSSESESVLTLIETLGTMRHRHASLEHALDAKSLVTRCYAAMWLRLIDRSDRKANEVLLTANDAIKVMGDVATKRSVLTILRDSGFLDQGQGG